MIAFYVGLALVNLGCFLPLYLLNVREQPNPIAFLTEEHFFNRKKLKLLYAKPCFTDPFHINFDFTIAILCASFLGLDGPWAGLLLAALLACSFVEIVYTSVMRAIFKRAPILVSDISFARVGLTIAHNLRFAIVGGLVLLVAAIAVASWFVVQALLATAPQGHPSLPVVGALVVPPGIYHWRRFGYAEYLTRTVYSPLMHFWLNIAVSRRFRTVLQRERSYFEKYNDYRALKLARRPNILTICIESYGSMVYRDPQAYAIVAPRLAEFAAMLERRGLRAASNFSAAPMFAGGSWMSYASFLYGIRISNVWLYDVLFTQSDGFRAYESLFHVLRRNGYRSELLCPLGGVDARYVDWDSIKRCFQSDRNIDFESLEFRGRRLTYFVDKHTYCAPDEYALNRGYEDCKRNGEGPFSLFYCTLNSHFPYHSPVHAAGDWRRLNDPDHSYPLTQEVCANANERYATAIRYQLEFILQFIDRHAGDDLVITLFGDHQPPLVAPESMGTETPVHVIASSDALIESFCAAGFAPMLDLTRGEPEPIRHEAFLSLMMRGMNAAFGADPALPIPRRAEGIAVFDEG